MWRNDGELGKIKDKRQNNKQDTTIDFEIRKKGKGKGKGSRQQIKEKARMIE